MKQIKRFTVRMSPAEFARINIASNQCESSINRYFVDSATKRIDDIAQESGLETVIKACLSDQTEMVGNALAQLAEQHAEQDQALRDDIKAALAKVLSRVQKGATK